MYFKYGYVLTISLQIRSIHNLKGCNTRNIDTYPGRLRIEVAISDTAAESSYVVSIQMLQTTLLQRYGNLDSSILFWPLFLASSTSRVSSYDYRHV